MATLPFLSRARGQRAVMTWGYLAMLLITIAKRLEANREPIAVGPERKRVCIKCLLVDRDIRDRKGWIHRRPAE